MLGPSISHPVFVLLYNAARHSVSEVIYLGIPHHPNDRTDNAVYCTICTGERESSVCANKNEFVPFRLFPRFLRLPMIAATAIVRRRDADFATEEAGQRGGAGEARAGGNLRDRQPPVV